MSERVLVLGATSAIACATERILAQAGATFFLVARDATKLAALRDDLLTRGAARVETEALDLAEVKKHNALIKKIQNGLGEIDLVLLAYGTLGDQEQCEASSDKALDLIQVNFSSAVSLLTRIASIMEPQGRGTIAVVSSVAGDRGRKSNYVYGAGKAGLTVFTDGLRNRLFKSGVHVVTIKPGFVDTPMTAHIKKGPLFVGPDVVARGIVAAVRKRRDVVYPPGFGG